jgi:hypothetical protein
MPSDYDDWVIESFLGALLISRCHGRFSFDEREGGADTSVIREGVGSGLDRGNIKPVETYAYSLLHSDNENLLVLDKYIL